MRVAFEVPSTRGPRQPALRDLLYRENEISRARGTTPFVQFPARGRNRKTAVPWLITANPPEGFPSGSITRKQIEVLGTVREAGRVISSSLGFPAMVPPFRSMSRCMKRSRRVNWNVSTSPAATVQLPPTLEKFPALKATSVRGVAGEPPQVVHAGHFKAYLFRNRRAKATPPASQGSKLPNPAPPWPPGAAWPESGPKISIVP